MMLKTTLHPDWIIPDWPAPKNIRAFITTRNGGVSQGSHAGARGTGGMNPGLRCDDLPSFVQANRAVLRKSLPAEPYWLKQVHGTRILEVNCESTAPDKEPLADGSYTHRRHQVCTVMVADCLPILLTNTGGQVVAAIHAGWRGLASGIVENTVATLLEEMAHYRIPERKQGLMAYLGPAIGPQAFEVGQDVYHAFTQFDERAIVCFVPQVGEPGKYLADLFALARLRLQTIGVKQIYGGGLCTVSSPERFYSYRRDKVTGRMAAFIWIDEYVK